MISRRLKQTLGDERVHKMNPPGGPPIDVLCIKEAGLDPVWIDFPLDWTVKCLKRAIENAVGLPVRYQRLLCGEEMMCDEAVVRDYGHQTILMARDSSHGPNGGRCLFAHGLRARPMPFFEPRNDCCDVFVRHETFECKEPITAFQPIFISMENHHSCARFEHFYQGTVTAAIQNVHIRERLAPTILFFYQKEAGLQVKFWCRFETTKGAASAGKFNAWLFEKLKKK